MPLAKFWKASFSYDWQLPARFLGFQAANLDEDKILALALGFMCSYTDIIIQSTKSLDLDQYTMQTLFSQGDISCTELQLYGFLYKWAVHRLNEATDGAIVRQEMGGLLDLVRFPLFTLTELVNGPVEHGTLLGDEIASLLHWKLADKKREMAFITDKRGEARQKPYIATIKIYSGYSKELSLDVQIELRADFAPSDCRSFREILDGECMPIRFVASPREITPYGFGGPNYYKRSKDAGLIYSLGVLWIDPHAGKKNRSITIMDVELEKNWNDQGLGIRGRIVNWTELQTFIKGPFNRPLRYKPLGYSDRFPVHES